MLMMTGCVCTCELEDVLSSGIRIIPLFRPVPKPGCSLYEKFDFSLKIDILIHNWTPKEYVPLDMLNMCIFYFGLPGNDCTKDEKTAEEVGRLRRPT